MNAFKRRLDIILTAILIGTLALHYAGLVSNTLLVAISLVGFSPVAWDAYQAFRHKDWQSMSLLASVALFFALLNREWASAVFIELMLAAARILEEVTKDRTQKNIKSLLKLRPNIALVENNGALVKTPIEKIRIGDIIIIGIEERIPIDGIIISGGAAVDESSITGESLPVDKNKGDLVLSSTLIKSGNIRVRTTRIGKDTTLEKIISLIESARNQKPSVQTMGEKFGKIYLISILFISAVLYLITRNLQFVLAIVLVVCADDIAVAIPLAYLEAIRKASSLGIIIKSARHLEMLAKVDTVVFDKTGTLTTGTLVVTEITPGPSFSKKDVLETAAIGSVKSNHPIAKAIIARATEEKVSWPIPETVDEMGGKGVIARHGKDQIIFGKQILAEEKGIEIPPGLKNAAEEARASGRSVSFVTKNNLVVGFVSAADEVKSNTPDAVSDLHSLGIGKIIMLTGDNPQTAKLIAEKSGIDEWRANLFPENKVEIIKELERESSVAMVGDGINDAAALSIANVGIAMGGRGMEGTIDSAQIVLMNDDLSTIPESIRIGRIAKQISVQDFWIWGISNVLGLILVFAGIIGPTGAAAYNLISDLFPLVNSLRISSLIKRRLI